MSKAQNDTVAMILGTLPTYEEYRSVNPLRGSGQDVLLLDPAEPLTVIAVDEFGSTNEFRDGEWHTGWEA